MLDGRSALLLNISASPGTHGEYSARVFIDRQTEPVAHTRFKLPDGSQASDLTAVALADQLTADGQFAASVAALMIGLPKAVLLLDLTATPLFAAPWETLTHQGTFAQGWTGLGYRPVIRYSPELSQVALVPLVLPVDVLVAEMQGWPGAPFEALAHPLKHFRTVFANLLDLPRVRVMLRSTGHDIVHIRGTAILGDGLAGLIAGHEQALRGAELRRLIRSGPSPARLVILETDQTSFPAMTALGHSVVGRAGPAVLVTAGSAVALDAFYYAITHDRSLVEAWLDYPALVAGQNSTALLLAHGGEAVLSLSQAAADLEARSRRQLARVDAALEYIDTAIAMTYLDHEKGDREGQKSGAAGVAPVASNLADAGSTLQAAASGLARIRENAYSYSRESQGMDPMTAATVEFEGMLGDIDTATAKAARVVNTWITDGGRVLAQKESVRAGRPYRLQVNVGPRLRRSNVRQPATVPEDVLEPLYDETGLMQLRVVLFSTDFIVEGGTATLELPRPPAGSRPASLSVVAPEMPGLASMHVGLYHQNNLIQSLVVTADVIPTGANRQGTGNSAALEWQISGSLADFSRFGEKTLNILTNETRIGTHLFGVVGTDVKEQVELGETEMKTMVTEARKALQWVCGDPAAGESYTYEPSNTGSSARFTEFMAGLAELGYQLYIKLVTANNDGLRERLDAKLGRSARIQIARVRSAKYAFPWNLVYDHPFVVHPSNRVCPDFLAALEGGASAEQLVDQNCVATGCAFRGDTNVVCPSGFWGFRHVIEQPLSTVRDPKQPEVDLRDSADVITRGAQTEVLLAYSEQLTTSARHLQDIGVLAGAGLQPLSSLFAIGKQMKRTDLQLVYFYCHGGNRRGTAWLGVGDRPPEEMLATNLYAWEIHWPTVRPMVFLNGCNTVGITPDDLLTFNDSLADANAAGVLGWEITIPETLGQQFGTEFVRGFLAGKPVGELVRLMRLGLLAGFNPLGLAYTPYCLANLHLA